VAAVNAALNGASERFRSYRGDLFDPVPDSAVYDQVVANIPFLPGATRGADGFDLGRRILAELPRRLSPAGSAQLTSLVMVTPEAVLLPQGLAEFAAHSGRPVRVSLGELWPVEADSEFIRTLADEAVGPEEESGADGTDYEARVEEILRSLQARKVTAAVTAFLHIGAIAGRGQVNVLDVLGGSRP
jgi:methylase of polypeptide subunit release factors